LKHPSLGQCRDPRVNVILLKLVSCDVGVKLGVESFSDIWLVIWEFGVILYFLP
jgi:hypothetical protein